MINEHNLTRELLKRFPELQSAYERECADYGEDEPGNYVVMGFVFKPRLKDELERGVVTDFLIRSAHFFEAVCASGDPEAINVIWVRIFEWLISEPSELALLWPHLGYRTGVLIRDAARRWNCSDVVPEDLA